MKDAEFELICIKICEGCYNPDAIPIKLDNMFYEKFGMSCREVVTKLWPFY